MFGQRLIDKKKSTNASVTKSPLKEMCDIAFCQLPSGEMKGLFSWLIFNKNSSTQIKDVHYSVIL